MNRTEKNRVIVKLMKSLVSLIFIIFFVHKGNAQNLIQNGDIEHITQCPTYDDAMAHTAIWKGWVPHWYECQPPVCPWGNVPGNCNPPINRIELYSYCADTSIFHPAYPNFHVISPTLNHYGHQVPRSGNNYLGINLLCSCQFTDPTVNYGASRVASNELAAPLKAKNYCLTFYVSMADYTPCASNRFDALFTAHKNAGAALFPSANNPPMTFTVKHQFHYEGGVIADSVNWTKISGRFKAQGGEKYMHVGNLHSAWDMDTLQLIYGPAYSPVTGGYGGTFRQCGGTYYYFDDFSLYELNDIVLSADTLLPCSGESLPVYAGGAEEYKWYDSNWELISTDSSILVNMPGTYYVVTRQCEAIDLQRIRVHKQNCTNIPPGPQFQIPQIPEPEIPNIITPGGNGQNDFFVIKNLQPNSELFIYNRWGNVVFESKDYQQNWDCNRCSDGTYFYVLITPGGKQYKGTVTVVGEK
jgi:gliding motility-associated-like protein